MPDHSGKVLSEANFLIYKRYDIPDLRIKIQYSIIWSSSLRRFNLSIGGVPKVNQHWCHILGQIQHNQVTVDSIDWWNLGIL